MASAAIPVLAGCSIAIPLSSLYSDEDTTGSIDKPVILSSQLDEEALHRAETAMAAALDPKSDGNPVAWQAPRSGAKGSFTPVAAGYRLANGSTCRAFLAEIEPRPSARQSMQGSACKDANGKWTIHGLRPWKEA